ncbi:MAG: type II secretion system GspH family protein [Candidatus Pacebacteria bacterium]|nr:type II secretion system GspH family protein [Candidatus Paceibacterota bacterium]
MKYQTSQEGFSLVETLVAITILLVVIVGPMTISSSAAKSTSFASEQVVAFFLAQEGAELAQKARDDILLRKFLPTLDINYLSDPWSLFASSALGAPYENCFKASGCGLELNTDTAGSIKTPIPVCSSSNCKLYFDNSDVRSRYTYSSVGNDDTLYTRVVFFETVNADELHVTSRVTWRTGAQRDAQEVTVETYLLDVYGN